MKYGVPTVYKAPPRVQDKSNCGYVEVKRNNEAVGNEVGLLL